MAPVSPSPMVRADTVNALAAGMEVRTAGRMAELSARRYMMMLVFEILVLREVEDDGCI